MAKKEHDIVIVSDRRFGAEQAVYVDGIGLGITEGDLGHDLEALAHYIKGPFAVRYADGNSNGFTIWPDDLGDVKNLVFAGGVPARGGTEEE